MDFALKGINHIGLAPKDPAKARWFFQQALGLDCLGEELVTSQKTNTVMLLSFSDAAGPAVSEDRLEILEPAPGTTDGPISKFLEKKGSGIHHIALTVDNVTAAIQHLLTQGVRMIDESPRAGAHATQIAFVHPESTGGLLVELVQEA